MERLRVAAIGDMHIGNSEGAGLSHLGLSQVVDSIGQSNPDVVLLCGDQTQTGSLRCTQVVADAFQVLADQKIPVLAVLGNHDYRLNNNAEKKAIYADGGIVVLDGKTYVLKKSVRESVLPVGVIGITGGFDGSIAKETRRLVKEAKFPKIPGPNIQQEIDKLLACLSDPTLPDSNLLMMHYAPSDVNLTGLTDRRSVTAGSMKFDEIIRSYPKKIQEVFFAHTHYARPIARIGTTNALCTSMQIGRNEARRKGKDENDPKNFYTLYERAI